MKWTTPLALLCWIAALTLVGCDSADPEEENVGEETDITTVVLTLEAGDRDREVAEWSDPDGPGGAPPTTDDLTIRSGIAYSGTVQFLDASDPSDVRDLTDVIAARAEQHRVFYTVEGGLGGRMTITPTDADAAGLPLGLAFSLRTDVDPPLFGELRLVLSHYAEGEKDGAKPGSGTDVDVLIEVNVLGVNMP